MSRVDPRFWVSALSAFDELVELSPQERAERLEAIGTLTPELRQEIEKLLAADENGDERLDALDRALGYSARQSGDLTSSDPLRMAGRSFSHFRVLEAIGRGGMGAVYRANDTNLVRPIALKFPLAPTELDTSSETRFLQEARAAGALDHPNICGILEAGRTDDGQLYFAMPLYEGETLSARLAREGPLPLDDAVHIARQIARGMRAAHDRGIIHRDLKPSNVMLLPNGQVKILDFGLAKVGDLALTRSRFVFGTISYMSPEQIDGRPAGPESDLWALGVILFEMLTGQRPFRGDHPLAVAHHIVSSAPTPVSAVRDNIPPALQHLIDALLTKDPANREHSAGVVIEALEKGDVLRQSRPTPRRSDTPGLGMRMLMRPQLIVLSVAVIGSIAAVMMILQRNAVSPPAMHSIAVLPPVETGADSSEQFLAVSLMDVVMSDLSRMRAVVVPSHLSTARYRQSRRPPEAIARELGVEAILLGNISRRGDLVRVDAELVRFPGKRRVWHETFEATVSQVQQIPMRVTRSVLAKLNVRPSREEIAALAQRGTSDPQAYELFLRGREAELRVLPIPLMRSVPPENIREAQTLYARAREIDPNFALARARLAITLMRGAWAFDTSSARREQARLEAEHALRLAPDLGEAHQALSEYWAWPGSDISKSIHEQELAITGSPNSSDMHVTLGTRYISAGRLDDAVTAFDRAARMDPRNPIPPVMSALFLLRMRRNAEALQAFDRVIELVPEHHMMKVIKGHTYLRVHGVPDTLAAVMKTLPQDWDPDGMATYARYTVLRVQRRHREALAMLDASRAKLSRDGLVYQPLALMKAETYHALGDQTRARREYDRARAFLEDSVAVNPDDASIHASLALAYAGLGVRDKAVREARRAMEIVPLSKNNPRATAFMGTAVEVFGRAGEVDNAVTLAELLLSMPAGREMTIPFLKVWPGFDPIRASPRYQQLIRRFEESHDNAIGR
jgi:serine/threonine protein kinase/tetratricopeptide (TPR) repeat protein